MKSTRNFLMLSLAFLFAAYACSDDDGNGITQPEPITPDLTEKIKTSVAGFVSDENGNPVLYASVVAGDEQATTDEFGYFQISDASVAKVAGQVQVTRSGYFDGYKTFLPQEDKETFIRLTLLTRSTTGTIDAIEGGSATTTDGSKITLSANSTVTADNGAGYTGQVQVSARLINVESGLSPGDGRGIDSNGHLLALKTFSALAVNLTAANGEQVQIGPNKTASIVLPIAPELVSSAPATIALWSLDTATGLWKQEGTATKNGSNYEATVSHFSFWQGAEGVPLVNVTARITDASAHPLANVNVVITIAGQPKNAGHGRFGVTDSNGYVTGPVFANTSYVLDVATPCASSAYSHNFSTAAADVNLGTLTGNMGQNAVTLNGTVTNCNNQPVGSGFVQTYDGGFYNRIPVVNGTFTFTGVMCTNVSVNLVVVDYNSYQQNIPKTVTINAGTNNLGTLKACGTSTIGNITYTLDDGPTVVIQEPSDTIAAYYLEPQGTATQIVTLSGDPNMGQKMAFQMTGADNTTTAHTITEFFSQAIPGGRGYWPVPIAVTITEFGKVGGFIAGSFESKIIASNNDNSVHDLVCSFRIRRYK